MEIIVGTAQLTRPYGVMSDHRSQEPTPAAQIIESAISAGVDALDTAPVYGTAEQVIGSSSWRGAIHTKFDPRLPPAQSMQQSLIRLHRTSVEVVYLHDPAPLIKGGRALLSEALDSATSASARLGVSVYEEHEFERALDHPAIRVIQVPLSILDQRFLGSPLERAAQAGVQVYARSVLLQGALTAALDNLPRQVTPLAPWLQTLDRLARDSGMSRYELAIGWVCRQANLTGLVVGTESAEDVAALGQAVRIHRVIDETWVALDDFAPPSFAQVDPRQW